jgi:hypothetical protein
MRYRVEYLVETTDETSVCDSVDMSGELEVVELKAIVGGATARRAHRASGFQIRDLHNGGVVVALETFDDPLSRSWPHAGHEVVH